MMNIPKSLSDIAEILGKKDYKTLKEEIDTQLSEIFIPAATIVGLYFSPDPITAIKTFRIGTALGTFKFSKLLKWLPDRFNYIGKGRELTAVERYEKAAVVNLMVLHLATFEGLCSIFLEETEKIILNSEKKFEKNQIEKIKKDIEEKEKALFELKFDLFNYQYKESIKNYTNLLCKPVLNFFHHTFISSEEEKQLFLEIEEKLERGIYLYYNAYLVSLINEFPEFAVWIDVKTKLEILQLNKNIDSTLKINSEKQESIQEEIKTFNTNFKKLIRKVETLKSDTFKANFGLKNWITNQEKLINRQTDKIEELLKRPTLEAIKAHHNYINSNLNELLVSEKTDIPDIVYPANKEIFTPQSFKTINYTSNKYKRRFLEQNFWDKHPHTKENIENFLTQQLLDPRNSNKGILILGHPGAGKSMLSKIIAARLTKSKEFFPFLVKLRDTTSKTANINDHLNEGLKKTGLAEVKWLEWAKEFKERIPVIILDGFDELLRASSTELNDYLNAIKRFQQSALHHEISARVILTSRLAIMQDVTIPENTTIIKLNSFDEKRQKLWIDTWNKFQTKSNYKPFQIPNNKAIQELAKEPLLLFMLAVYDFEGNELQQSAKDKNFNQSKLYDKLFIRFTERQIKKDENFGNLSPSEQKRKRELFRLRLGLMSLMMFQKDITYMEEKGIDNELRTFQLSEPNLKPKDLLNGFFFVHENKSTEETKEDNYVFEFLHKTFGEFLTADFLLRVTLAQNYRPYKKQYGILSEENTFNFCFGYNWLHKHKKILSFFFEYTEQFFNKKCRQKCSDFILDTEDMIKEQLEKVLATSNLPFPIGNISLIENKPIIEHLAIYSQNLILLWVALKQKETIPFYIYTNFSNSLEQEQKYIFENQDRNEVNKNKKLWKDITKLWELSGNSFAVAKLKEWIRVTETEKEILLKFQIGEIKHNYSDAAEIACNDFEAILIQNDKSTSLRKIISYVNKKPEFLELAIKTINNRFDILVENDEYELLDLPNKLENIELISKRELMRLIQNYYFYFPKNIDVNKIIIRKSVKYPQSDVSKERILEFNDLIRIYGNFQYIHQFYARGLNPSKIENTAKKIITHSGLYRCYYFIKNLDKAGFGDMFSQLINLLLEKRLEELISIEDLNLKIDYLELIRDNLKTGYMHTILVDSFSILIHDINKDINLNTKKQHNFNRFLKSLVQILAYNPKIKYKKEINDVIADKFNEIVQMPLSDKYLNELHPFYSVEIFELLIIFVNNPRIENTISKETIFRIINVIIKHWKKKRRRFPSNWNLKIIDFLSIINKSNQVKKLIEEEVKFYLEKIMEDEFEYLNYYDFLRILYTLAKMRREASNDTLLYSSFYQFFEETEKLKKIDSELGFQFAVLAMECGFQEFVIYWNNEYFDLFNRNIDERYAPYYKLDIRYALPFKELILSNLKPNFYYEINPASDIPRYLLDRSILHGKDDE